MSQSASKSKILIIEDDQMLVEMYKDKLKFEGYRVITATDGKKALLRMKEGADLILLDILMPHLNGFEVLKKIKAEPMTKDTPVIVLTNLGTTVTENDKALAMSLGATDYMIKSLNTPEDVVARIEQIMSGAKVS